MSAQHIPPTWGGKKFNCPRCGALAQQDWSSVFMRVGKADFPRNPEESQRLVAQAQQITPNIFGADFQPPYPTPWFGASKCLACDGFALWRYEQLIWPAQAAGSPPEADMPPDVRQLYEEARRIVAESPRAAAALLRLGIDKMSLHLGAQGNDLHSRIQSLREKGVPERAISAMHGIRKGGNQAVHPGEIDLGDQREIADQLFKFLNLTVEYTITKPRELDDFHARMAERKKN